MYRHLVQPLKFALILSISLFLVVDSAKAQTKDAKTKPKAVESKPAEASIEDELSKESATAPSKTVEPDKNKGSSQDVKGYDAKNALRGYSFGGTVFNQSFGSSIALNLDGTAHRVAGKTSDFQFVGGVIKYSEFPYGSIGTDISLSAATSVNHANVGYKPITALKFDVSLGYAWQTTSHASLYFYGGIGYENLSSKDLNYFAAQGGNYLQLGLGMNYSKTITLEGVFQFSRHPVGSVYLDSLVAAAKAQGFTNVEYDYESSVVTSNTIMGRLLYHF